MKNFKPFIVICTLLLIGCFSLSTFAQDTKPVPLENDFYGLSSSTNDVNALTKVKPQEQVFSTQKQKLLNDLENARLNGNTTRAAQLHNQLNAIDGGVDVPAYNNPGVRYSSKPIGVPFKGEEGDFNYNLLTNQAVWGIATATVPTGAPNAGRIWAAATLYNGSGSDTCKFWYSDNGGASWTQFNYFYFPSSNIDYRADELDIEILYDGTNVWLWGVAGLHNVTSNRTTTIWFRWNTTVFAFAEGDLSFPGIATTTNVYYNPHITSDNTNYTSAAYIYMSNSFDSLYGGTNHYYRQKFVYCTNPTAATPTFTYNNPTSGGFYWNSAGAFTGYLWTDLAYFQSTAGNRIITVYNVPMQPIYNMYVAWSNDYGATIAGNLVISESNVDYGARIAFNGGTTNYNGMIAYVRQFSGVDWDPYYRNTTNGGATLADWSSGYIDGSSNRTRSVDIVAPRLAANLFRVGYAQDSASVPWAFYVGGNPSGWNTPSRLAVNPSSIKTDTAFGRVKPGYRLGGGDDCFIIWESGSGAANNAFISRLCQTTVGIGNNNSDLPKIFSLSQNYPNPFNPSTQIKFSIPTSGFVKLAVYDLVGKEVANLVNGNLNAGYYTYTYDASSLASGVYFYTLKTGNFQETKKMTLIK